MSARRIIASKNIYFTRGEASSLSKDLENWAYTLAARNAAENYN